MSSPDDSPFTLASWLAEPASGSAQESAAIARTDSPSDPLAAAAALRQAQPDLSAAQASAALDQATLRALAHERYGIRTPGLLLTRDGLEQATRPVVAAQRARLLAAGGARRIVDLTGGLGFDTAAFLAAGLDVTVVERDPVTAVMLAHNCPGAHVVAADSTDPDVLRGLLAGLAPTDVLFADPARRDPTGARGAELRARPERDPARWSPPWPVIETLPHPRIAAKVAPSFRPPDTWHAEWVSVRRSLVECAVYSWPVFAAARRALAWSGDTVTVIEGNDSPLPASARDIGAWLHEPDPAIVRAGAIAGLIRAWSALLPVGPQSSWLTSDAAVHAAPLRSFEVIARIDGSATDQRRQLDRLGVTRLTVKGRDVDVAPAAVLHDLDRREGIDHVLVVTRYAGRSIRILCAPARQRSA